VSNNVKDTLARHWGDLEKSRGDTMGHFTTLRRHQGHEATRGKRWKDYENVGDTRQCQGDAGDTR
jgi:hypothetical protein